MKTLKTRRAVIKALGGTMKVAKIFDVEPSAVSGWKRRGRFLPAKTYVAMQELLHRNNYQASSTLWGQ